MLSTDTNLTEYNFVLATTAGESISLTPKKKTVIYFFAPWCKICHASIENLQEIYQKDENLDVIAVALDYLEPEEINDFVADHQLTFPVAFGNEEVKKAYKIKAYPSYYVVDKENTVLGKSMGYSTEMGLYIRSL